MTIQTFKPQKVLESIFTGGQVIRNGDFLFLNGGDSLSVLHIPSKNLEKIPTGVISCFSVSPDGKLLVVALQSLIINIYSIAEKEEFKLDFTVLHKFKAHEAPVLVMDFDPTSTLVATGSADSTIKIWDAAKGHATHNLKGHAGVLSALKFHPLRNNMQLASGSDDCKVRLWDLNTKKCIHVLDTHVSIVRGVSFSDDGNSLFSCSRDQTFTKFNISSKNIEFTIPVFESLEACAVVHYKGQQVLCTAGEKGIIKLWDTGSGELIDEQVPDKNYSHPIQGLNIWDGEVIAFTGDQNIWFFDLKENITRYKQIAGYNEEVLDLCLMADNSHLAVITNTEQIRIYDLQSFDCEIIYGHGDIVLTVANSFDGQYLATGGKDHAAKVWTVDFTAKTDRITEYHTFTGHTAAVTAVALGKSTNKFLLTASQDRTIKCWYLDSKKLGQSKYTVHAHEKDIQSIDVSPNDAWFVTASLDKTAKVFTILCSSGQWKMDR